VGAAACKPNGSDAKEQLGSAGPRSASGVVAPALASDSARQSSSAAGPAATPGPSSGVGAYPAPELDLGADRLHERVDGGAELLRKLGCRRLLYWRSTTPLADIEVLAFASSDGASQMLGRDAGPDRSKGVPGDEGFASAQVVYFRRGAVYARLIADQAVAGDALLGQAQKLARALETGELRP